MYGHVCRRMPSNRRWQNVWQCMAAYGPMYGSVCRRMAGRRMAAYVGVWLAYGSPPIKKKKKKFLITVNGVWRSVYGGVCWRMVHMYGYVWQRMAMAYGGVWPYMAIHGHTPPYIAIRLALAMHAPYCTYIIFFAFFSSLHKIRMHFYHPHCRYG